MRKIIALLSILTALLLQTGCLYAARYDGPYSGKVIDKDTGEPIEGAVVLGTWSIYHFDLAGGHHTYHDARETLTDKNGDFIIPGQGLRIISNLEPMSVLIFKAGYSYFGSAAWESIKIAYAKEIKWEGDRPTIPIKKLTIEERKKGYGPPMEAPENKMPLMLREINADRNERGLRILEEGGK